MKAPRPLGTIRLLEPVLGRARRRWRGGPFLPLIWRRRPRAPRAPEPRTAAPAAAAPASVLNLTLVWPALLAERTGPLRTIERHTIERLRAGRDAGAAAPGRLVALVERLWSRAASERTNVDRSGDAPAPEPPASAPQILSRAEMAAPRRPLAPAPRVHRLGGPRGGAMRGGEPAAAGPVPEATEARQPRRPVAAVRQEMPARRPTATADGARLRRLATELVWRKEEARGDSGAAGGPLVSHGQRRRSPDLVWRRAAPGPMPDEGHAPQASASAVQRHDAHPGADRPGAASAPPSVPAAAMPPAEMNRLVDEVVRRLGRIGRDERLRRGL